MRPHEKLDLWKKAIAQRLNYVSAADYKRLTDDLDHIGRMITRLSQSLGN
jgi:hypothetical protein